MFFKDIEFHGGDGVGVGGNGSVRDDNIKLGDALTFELRNSLPRSGRVFAVNSDDDEFAAFTFGEVLKRG